MTALRTTGGLLHAGGCQAQALFHGLKLPTALLGKGVDRLLLRLALGSCLGQVALPRCQRLPRLVARKAGVVAHGLEKGETERGGGGQRG